MSAPRLQQPCRSAATILIALSALTGCAILDGLGAGVGDTTEPLEPCDAHRDCYAYCSIEGCLSFQDITWYSSYRPCDGNDHECNRQTYPADNGLTCPGPGTCTCVYNTCLASTGVACTANDDCSQWQFCNITDSTCTYTFNCSRHDDCSYGVCGTAGCAYGSGAQLTCTNAGVCGAGGLCINDRCWRLTSTTCDENADCPDDAVCSRPNGAVCVVEVKS